MFYSGFDRSNENAFINCYAIDTVILDHTHPVFKDYLNDTWRVRWGSGFGFYVPPDDPYISRLVSYPAQVLNDHNKYIAWSFPLFLHRGILWIKYFLDEIKSDPILKSRALALLLSQYYIDGDFKKVDQAMGKSPMDPKDWANLISTPSGGITDYYNYTGWVQHQVGQSIKYADPHLNNNLSSIAFTYPEGESDGGRVFLSGYHPELPDWDDTSNYILHEDDSGIKWKDLTLWHGLDHWVLPGEDKTEMTFKDTRQGANAWFIRREVAWASKCVPDDELPPVYNSSQVVDITPTFQNNLGIIVKCCVGRNSSEGPCISQNLSLYYRYKGAGSNYIWTNWTRYNSITHLPYHFAFNSPYGAGRYEFYSLFNYSTSTMTSNELPPPGADASCILGCDIFSDFSYTPVTPYDHQLVEFSSHAATKEGTTITSYEWQFGDGEVSPDSLPHHRYNHPGVYTVNLTVTNDHNQQDTARKTITVFNQPPQAQFLYNPPIALVNTNITFADASFDPNGTIVSWNWDFGDNTTSALQNPHHAYNKSGYYTVSLRVIDNDNGNDTETKPNCILIYNANASALLLSDSPQQHAWKTIQKAIDNSSTRDIIYIGAGTYHENLTINKSVSLIGHDQSDTIINGSVTMIAPHDYELPSSDSGEWLFTMNGTNLLMHFNNDTSVGENYASSSVIYDYSGLHHNGTRHNLTWSTNTLKGKGCFDFDKTTSMINLTVVPVLTGQNVTVSAWIYWNSNGGSLLPIISQRTTQNRGYCLAVNDTTDKPFFQLDNNLAISSTALTTGWHHIVGTHNQTTLAIYIDGTCTSTIAKTDTGVSATGYIGFDNAGHHYRGRIDEVAIWNKTFTDDDISAMYKENIGVSINGLTIKGGTYGISPCNHTEVDNCAIKNTPIGITMNNIIDVRFNQCNITNCGTGIQIKSSLSDLFNRIRIVSSNIKNVTNGMYVNDSSNVTVIGTTINGTKHNLTFNGQDFGSLSVINSGSSHNNAPDIPSLSGATLGDPGKTYTYTTCTNDSNRDQMSYMFDWGDGNNTGWFGPYLSNHRVNASHTWRNEGGYYVNVKARDVFANESDWKTLLFKTEELPPIITQVQHSPDTVGFGGTVSIQANVTDNKTGNWSGINTVHVNISYPDQTYGNFTMNYAGNNIYQYNFSDTWLVGQYNFSIWAQDNAYNGKTSSGYHFHVSAQAQISIATLKDAYSGNQFINITDPSNPPENLTLVGRGLTWNTYYNASSGCNILESYQGPINYEEDNGSWTPINESLYQLASNYPAYNYGYRVGNAKGLYGVYFKPNAQQDWPVAYTYNRSNNPTTYVVRSKLVGVGYLDPASNWSYQYLQSVQSSQGQSNGNAIMYPGIFTGTDVTWSYRNTELKEAITMSNATKTVLQNHPPSQYGLHDASSYLVFITKLEHQNLNMYNTSGMLSGNVTITDSSVDFKDALGVFKCGLPLGDAYEPGNESVQQKLTYRIIHLNGNTYLLAGLKVADLAAMMFPVVIDPTLTVYSTSNDGYIYKSDTDYTRGQTATTGTVNSSGQSITIGQKKVTNIPATYYVYRGFVLFNTSSLPSNAYLDNATLSLYKKDDYSTTDFSITVQNGQPVFPHNPLQSSDYNKNWYSGNGGTYNTSGFHNGYNNITLSNLNWITKGGTTKFCLRSNRDINANTPTGNEYVNVYANEKGSGYQPKLVVVYRNQSKIKNTGTTNMQGYLLLQIQSYNSSQGTWVADWDVDNETSPRTINTSSQLALDTIFNGLIRASDLSYGTGTYRVYVALRDPVGNILRCNNGVELKVWWQFSANAGT